MTKPIVDVVQVDPKTLRALGDEALINALGDVVQLALTKPSEWERAFVSKLPEVFIQYGQLTWKQRRAARRLLEVWVARMNRAQRMRAKVGGA